jgi:hypothetical protein
VNWQRTLNGLLNAISTWLEKRGSWFVARG